MKKQARLVSPGRKKLSEIKLSPITFLIIVAAIASGTYLVTKKLDSEYLAERLKGQTDDYRSNLYDIKRMQGFKYVKPLISAKPVNEYDGYIDIKQAAQRVIDNYKNSGAVSSASVYFRDFDKSNWFGIDKDTKYNPGSLLKLPALMTFLLMEEDNPALFNKSVEYLSKPDTDKDVHFISKSLQFGRRYTINELLSYMIIYSDNEATSLLNTLIDKKTFVKLFSDLGLEPPDLTQRNYPVSAKDCSVFLEALLNALYLKPESSEYAMSLLVKSEFKEGIIKGIGNPDVVVAHKFGEAGTNKFKELHETAVFYINEKPYLLTVMTKGTANAGFEKLESLIQEVTHSIYTGLLEKQ
jgi:beta-lactamase class A